MIADLDRLVLELAEYPEETEWLEFKENLADPEEIGEYISALANSAALHDKPRAYIVWGIGDASHALVGTTFQPSGAKIGNEDLEPWLARLLFPRIHFRFFEGEVTGKRVVLLEIPSAAHTPVRFKTEEFIRVGSYKKKLREHPEKERVLWARFHRSSFEEATAGENVAAEDVMRYLDHQAYYALADLALPDSRDAVLERFVGERFLVPAGRDRYHITNLGGLSFGRDLSLLGLDRKAVRVVVYEGAGRLRTLKERQETRGYGAAFQELIDYVNGQLPLNEHIGRALRRTTPMYPGVAVRELVANALIHQDFHVTGTGPMIEIFSDRVEITNPGVPLIAPERFMDLPPRSRNERLATLMRRMNICEERGSGAAGSTRWSPSRKCSSCPHRTSRSSTSTRVPCCTRRARWRR